MEEVPSNQDNPEIRHFLSSITGAMLADRGEQFAGSSSFPEARWDPMVIRRPSNLQAPLHDMEMLGSNLLGLENPSLIDAQLLTSALENMNLGLTDVPDEEYAANSFSVAFRDGHCPTDLVIASADRARNGSLQPTFTQTDDFVHSPLMINNAENMRPTFGDQISPVCIGMNGSQNVYATSINLPPASPFQQQHFINGLSQKYVPHQQVDSKFRWHDIDVEHSIMKADYSYQQMSHVATSDVGWIDSSQCGGVDSFAKSSVSPHLRTPIVHPLGDDSSDIYWNDAISLNGNNQMNPTRLNNGPYTICSDCSCESCAYSQVQLSEKLKHQYGLRRSPKGSLQNRIMDKVKLKSSPERILMKSDGLNSIINIKPGYAFNGCADGNRKTNCNRHNHHINIQSKNSLLFDLQSSQFLPSLESDLALKSARFDYNSVDEVVGEFYLLAKDQNGCRFLQKIFTEGSQDDAQKVFDGVIEHIDELMIDAFGNYLVQKLLEECNEDQKMHIVYQITERPGLLIKVSCNMHGTRVVQKLIETIKNSDEASMVVSALSPGAITLMMDANGSHVAHRCLQKLSPEYKAFLLNAATAYCFELAKDRHGCCIIQKCILHANKEQKNRLLYNITSRTLDLSEHQYGNYVIQYILDLNVSWATDEILDRLEGHYGYLSVQKCSSNVVEKCIKAAREPKQVKIINELISDPKLLHILLDQFGNYVIQTALRECEDAAAQAALADAIKPHTAALRNNMFGKRILSKTCLKNRKS